MYTQLYLHGKSCPGQDRNQMFWPSFARGLWPETFKASFSRTNQTVNKRRRQKKRVKIVLNHIYLNKTQPGRKLLEISRFFLNVYSPDVMVSRFRYPGGDIAFPIDNIGRGLPSLVYATSSQVMKSLDKTSFQFHY